MATAPHKPRLGRLQRLVKWGAGAACVAMLVCWLGSTFVSVSYSASAWGAVGLDRGLIVMIWSPHGYSSGWHQVAQKPPALHLWFHWWRDYSGWLLDIPLWIPLLAAAIVAVRAWSLDRRPGLCPHCRYDLTGNTTGVCPECGAPPAHPPKGLETR